MIRTRHAGPLRWAGSLLTIVQFATVCAASAIHAQRVDAFTTDHAEPAGTEHHSHDEAACPACRHLDTRAALDRGDSLLPEFNAITGVAAHPHEPREPRRPRLESIAPRAPPAASTASAHTMM